MKFSNIQSAKDYIYSFIPRQTTKLYPGKHGLERTKYLLSLLGNPQERIKTIHIAGTSGKGSTAYLTSCLLLSHGFTTGLISKPHLFDIRERYMINNKLISENDFCRYVARLYPAIEKVKLSEFNAPTYAEINAALAYFIFADKKVDYAVIETYLGGLLDCTNVIERPDKLVVLTRIGFDHTKILGNTLSEIALQKAGIIHNYNTVISLWQQPQVRKVFEIQAGKMKTGILYIIPEKNFKNVELLEHGISFDYVYPAIYSSSLHGGKYAKNNSSQTSFSNNRFKDLQLGLYGEFQAENAALALTSLVYLAERDGFTTDDTRIRGSFRKARYFGRMDIYKYKNKYICLDGAHNPQKMKAFIKSLIHTFPSKKLHFLVAFSLGKDIKKMLRLIIPKADKITVSSFFTENQDWIRKAIAPSEVARILDSEKFTNYQTFSDIKIAFESLMKDSDDVVVVTGSLYFLSEIYPLLRERGIFK